MPYQSMERLTLGRHFLEPTNSTHRHYESLRAYYVEGLTSAEVAERFGYSPGSFRVLAHQFRQNPERAFFLPSERQSKPHSKRKRFRDRVVALRKQNLSVQDISRARRSAPPPYRSCSRKRALRGCRGGWMKNVRRVFDRRWPM
jgi:hypothetical protein